MAEREGFEPSRPFWSLHAFQACALDRSAISPHPSTAGHVGVRLYKKDTISKFLMEIFVPTPTGAEDRSAISPHPSTAAHGIVHLDKTITNKKGPRELGPVKNGGDERDRTADLLVANETLSQLSYIPTSITFSCGGLP
jgi:hypothetical protein